MQQGSYLPSLKSSQLMHLRCWNMPNIAFFTFYATLHINTLYVHHMNILFLQTFLQ